MKTLTKNEADNFVFQLRLLCKKFGGYLRGWDDGSIFFVPGMPDDKDKTASGTQAEWETINVYTKDSGEYAIDYRWDGKETE